MTFKIIQHATEEMRGLITLVSPVNQAYAQKCGCTYIQDVSRICPERSVGWEKIAFIRQQLATSNDGDLVIWTDADSVIVGNDDIKTAIEDSCDLSMCRIMQGINGSEFHPKWFNAGTIFIRNKKATRDFFDNLWARSGAVNDEANIVAELTVNKTVKCENLDPKWNCWQNNQQLVKVPQIIAQHGVAPDKKETAVANVIKVFKS